MYESIALYDRVAAVMPPEELPDLWVLADFAEAHGLNVIELLAPVVGDEAAWIHEVMLRMGNGAVAQQVLAGLDDAVWEAIEDTCPVCCGGDPLDRWVAACEAADAAGLSCRSWAAVADVAVSMEWPLGGSDYVRLCRTAPEAVVRAVTAARVLAETGDVVTAWDAATGPLTREVR